MSAKQTAIQDIKDDLKLQGKSFLAFRSELNSVMNKLVFHHIMEQKCQQSLFPVHCTRANSQLVAHCLFCKGEVKLTNYSKYYESK